MDRAKGDAVGQATVRTGGQQSWTRGQPPLRAGAAADARAACADARAGHGARLALQWRSANPSSQERDMQATATAAVTTDLVALKGRQQAAWASGDYAVIGTTLQIVGESLAEACDLRTDERVLDVAAGNGNATLAAARRGCRVTSTDYVAALLDRGAERAAAERLEVSFQQADAEALPFADASFDAVVSTFGVMFAPDHARSAAEMVRVCRPGGRIGLANWTPEGFIGQLFKTLGKHIAPLPGVLSPALWGSEAHLRRLFGNDAPIAATKRIFNFRYRSAAHFLDVFRTWYGPVHKAFAALPGEKGEALERDLVALLVAGNRAGPESLVVPSEYLEIVVTRA
jgi:SAM-dependent methyltransferase